MQKLVIGLLVGLVSSATYAQIRNSSGALVTPQLSGNASDVLKGDGTVGAVEGGSGLPSGAIIFIDTGSCPTGYTEVAALNDKMVRGTVDASGDVGQTGGSDSVTPTFTGDASAVVVNHTHVVEVTDPGHAHGEQAPSSASSGAMKYALDTNASGTQAAGLNTASATTGITATTANPAGGAASYTPAGTISAIDNKAAYVNLIGCKKD